MEATSDLVFAIQRLWGSALGNLLWILSCSLACLVTSTLLLRKLLRPFDYMARQPGATTHHEPLTLHELPETSELRRVVGTMNLVVAKLKSLFEG